MRRMRAAALVTVGVLVGSLLVTPVGAHLVQSTRHLGVHAWTEFIRSRVYTRAQVNARTYTRGQANARFLRPSQADAAYLFGARIDPYCRLAARFPASYPSGPCPEANTSFAYDPVDAVGFSLSVAIGVDGAPVVAAYNSTDDAVEIVRCTTQACTDVESITYNNPQNDDIGLSVSVAIGTDGIPVIAAKNFTDDGLELIRCTTPACTDATSFTYDPGGEFEDIGDAASVAIGTDGIPVIASRNDSDNAVEIVRCTTPACTDATSITHDTGDDVGNSPVAVAIGADGIPVIASHNETDDAVDLIRCTTPDCAAATTFTYENPDDDDIGQFGLSVAIGLDGIPVVAARNNTDAALELIRCTTPVCTDATSITYEDPDDDNLALSVSVAIGTDGVPAVGVRNATDGDVELIRCTTPACTDVTSTTFAISGLVGDPTSMAVGTDGIPVVAARNTSFQRIEIIRAGTLP